MKKIYIIMILLIMILLSLSLSTAGNQSKNDTIYRAGINNYGFYRVFDATLNGPTSYKNHTFNINVGDTVIWINDIDDKATIVSKQGLWNKTKGELRWMYKQFIYTFNRSGIYTFYIKERSKQEQKIIVGPIVKPTPIPTVKITPGPTPIKVSTVKITPKPTSVKAPVPTKTPIKTQAKTLKNKDLEKNRSSSTITYKKTPGFGTESIVIVMLLVYTVGKRRKIKKI